MSVVTLNESSLMLLPYDLAFSEVGLKNTHADTGRKPIKELVQNKNPVISLNLYATQASRNKKGVENLEKILAFKEMTFYLSDSISPILNPI